MIGIIMGVSLIGLGLLLTSIRIVNQWEKGLLFTFGKYTGLKQPGLNFVIPIIQTISRVDMRIRTLDVKPQEAITKDSNTKTY